MYTVALVCAVTMISQQTVASEYCERQFEKDLSGVNAELGAIYAWQKEHQATAEKLVLGKKAIDASIENATKASIPDAEKLKMISSYIQAKNDFTAQEDKLVQENTAKLKRISELKGSVPQGLKDKAKSCAEEIAPINMVVNLAIQGLAMYFTDGDSLVLPKKALYVDMGEIMHGNVMGGPHSAPNDVKNWVNGRLGTKF